uniref:Uncharacterized protein n=1 Tax=Nothobranchius kadleci TaxID=1051664 RepID=A0A1A8BAV2_NOTKA
MVSCTCFTYLAWSCSHVSSLKDPLDSSRHVCPPASRSELLIWSDLPQFASALVPIPDFCLYPRRFRSPPDPDHPSHVILHVLGEGSYPQHDICPSMTCYPGVTKCIIEHE